MKCTFYTVVNDLLMIHSNLMIFDQIQQMLQYKTIHKQITKKKRR